MSEIIYDSFPSLEESAAQTRVTASSTRLATPLVQGTNHLLGRKQNSLIHMQTMDTGDNGSTNKERIMTYRHENCEYLLGWFIMTASAQSSASITCLAGTGTEITETRTATSGDEVEIWVLFPWDSNDSGWQEVSYEVEEGSVLSASIWSCPRAELTTGDTYIETTRSTALQAGFGPNQFIINDTGTSDCRDLQAKIKAAKDAVRPQAASWSDYSNPATTDADTYDNPFHSTDIDFEFRHQAPRFTSGDATQSYRVYLRTSGNCLYSWQVTTSQETQGQTGLGGGAMAGWEYVEIDVDCTADDSFLIEMKIDGSEHDPEDECKCFAVSIGMA